MLAPLSLTAETPVLFLLDPVTGFWARLQVQIGAKEGELAAACKASDAVTEGLVHRLLVELETGGNIRSTCPLPPFVVMKQSVHG